MSAPKILTEPAVCSSATLQPMSEAIPDNNPCAMVEEKQQQELLLLPSPPPQEQMEQMEQSGIDPDHYSLDVCEGGNITPGPTCSGSSGSSSSGMVITPSTSSPIAVGGVPCTNGIIDGQHSLPNLQSFRAYSADDFLSRVNMNDKINNILRIPAKTNNGVRQRSVYTASISQSRSSGGSMGAGGNGSSSSGGLTPKESIPSSLSCQMPMPVHMTTLSPHALPYTGNGYDSPMARRSPVGGMGRKIFENRYPSPMPPRALSPVYEMMHMAGTPPMPSTSCMSPSHVAQQFPQPMPPPPYAMGRLSAHRDEFQNRTPSPCPGAGPIAMANGTIQLRLREGIRIDMTLDKAVRILNQRSMVAIALSRNCSNSALIHPNGRVLQSGSKVEIVTYDGMKSNNYVRFAKMWYKGVSFTSESCALIYLVDTAGTRTTTDSFTDLTKDYTLTVFYDDSRHGPSYVQDANEVIQNSTYSCTDEGTEIYEINGFRITQAADGLVKLTRTHNKCLIRTSPGNGSATLTTPGIHCTASLGKTSHLFVRRNEKRMHFDGSCFIVRNAGHSAGFNENNLLIVY